MRLLYFAIGIAMTTPAPAEVAISIRYFKVEGTSHYHLYLYSDDAKLLRQLTAPETAHDTAPMFSPDGKLIYFTRDKQGQKAFLSIRIDGTQLQTLEAAPAGYPPQPPADQAYALTGGGENAAVWQSRGDDFFLTTPDGTQELILKSADNFKHIDGSQFDADCFKALTIREVASGQEKRVPTGGDAEDNYCELATRMNSPFLIAAGLRLAFYWQWQGSTAGPRLGALDLTRARARFLSDNPAVPIPHGSRAGFFCVCEERYQALGKTGKTVDCVYLDWWDPKLQRSRFAKAVALFGGASARTKDQAQLDIRAPE
jgi:hypothetical protein